MPPVSPSQAAQVFFRPSRWFRWSAVGFLVGLFLYLGSLVWNQVSEAPTATTLQDYSFQWINLTLVALVYGVLFRFTRFLFHCFQWELRPLKHRKRWVWGVLLLALFLNTYRADYGLPNLYVHDEDLFQRQVEQMVRHPTFFGTKKVNWPSMGMNLAVIPTVLHYAVAGITKQQLELYVDTVLSSRWFMGFLTTVQVLLLMLMARRLVNWHTAFWVGILASSNLAMNVFAHQARIDPATSFLVTTTLYLALLYRQTPQRHLLLIWGLSLGFAAGAKYHVGVLALGCVILLLHQHRSHWKQSMWVIGVLAVSSMVGFWIAIPLLPFRVDEYVAWFFRQVTIYQTGFPGHEGTPPENFRFYLDYLLREGGGFIVLIGATLGLAWLSIKKDWGVIGLLGSYVVLQFGLLVAQTVRFERNLLPVIPVLCLLAGIGWSVLWKTLWQIIHKTLTNTVETKRSPFKRYFFITGILLIFGVQFPMMEKLFAYYNDASGPDTRTVARDWLRHHVDNDQPIMIVGSLVEGPQRLPHETVYYQKRFLPEPDWDLLKSLSGYLLLSSDNIEKFASVAAAIATHEQLLHYTQPFNPTGPVAVFQQTHRIRSGPTLWLYRIGATPEK